MPPSWFERLLFPGDANPMRFIYVIGLAVAFGSLGRQAGIIQDRAKPPFSAFGGHARGPDPGATAGQWAFFFDDLIDPEETVVRSCCIIGG
jgi:hypothetical protein